MRRETVACKRKIQNSGDFLLILAAQPACYARLPAGKAAEKVSKRFHGVCGPCGCRRDNAAREFSPASARLP